MALCGIVGMEPQFSVRSPSRLLAAVPAASDHRLLPFGPRTQSHHLSHHLSRHLGSLALDILPGKHSSGSV